jgi:hypothetical protein
MIQTVLFCGDNVNLRRGAWLKSCRSWLAVLAVMYGLGGCATYSGSFSVIEKNLAARQYDAALVNIEKAADAKNDRCCITCKG